MSIARKSLQLAQVGVRRLATTPVKPATCPAPQNVHPGYKKIRSTMEKFQVEDGVPVHLKGGAMDKILYQATIFLCAIGLGMSGHLFYKLSYPSQE
ncbi:hypothetical protein R5R35_006798 [Gryllus longicercus]|uniref:Uncharacterized protein n=1 Tax=Gryllus longicercus TaxID=2509291 RepID=A0AAN9V3K4_9ORTH